MRLSAFSVLALAATALLVVPAHAQTSDSPVVDKPVLDRAEAEAWMQPLLEVDRDRIRRIAASRDKALQEAAGGKPADLRAVTDLVRAPPQSLDPNKLEGRWRCRSYELGGTFPLTVNPFFECRIRRTDQALVLEKLTGSVRRNARLDPIDRSSLLFYGAYRASGDPQRSYGAGDDYHNEVGILQALSPDRLRLELPEPRAYNSAHHEVVELVRAR